jgi:hypothetical protein
MSFFYLFAIAYLRICFGISILYIAIVLCVITLGYSIMQNNGFGCLSQGILFDYIKIKLIPYKSKINYNFRKSKGIL